jgi:hypothetical protein
MGGCEDRKNSERRKHSCTLWDNEKLRSPCRRAYSVPSMLVSGVIAVPERAEPDATGNPKTHS